MAVTRTTGQVALASVKNKSSSDVYSENDACNNNGANFAYIQGNDAEGATRTVNYLYPAFDIPEYAVINSVKFDAKRLVNGQNNLAVVFMANAGASSSSRANSVWWDQPMNLSNSSYNNTTDQTTETTITEETAQTQESAKGGNLIDFLNEHINYLNEAGHFRIGWAAVNSSSYSVETIQKLYYCLCTINYTIPDFTLAVTAGTGGTVTGGGTYQGGSEVTIRATPNSNYIFKQWSDGNTDAVRTVTVTGDMTLSATFARVYTYTFYPNAGSDTVTNMPEPYMKEYGVSYRFRQADEPSRNGYKFDCWLRDYPDPEDSGYWYRYDTSLIETQGTATKGSSTNSNANRSFYAHWIPLEAPPVISNVEVEYTPPLHVSESVIFKVSVS